MDRRTLLLTSVSFCGAFLFSTPCFSEIQSQSDAINKSGRLRMLSQRIAKAYLQLGLKVDVEHSRKIFDSSIASFDKQLIELKSYAPTTEIKTQLLQIEKLWLAYKDLLIGRAPNTGDAQEILKLSDQLLLATEDVTKRFELQANSRSAQLVNIAGRQRMLSQRMAKLYQAQQWKLNNPEIAKELASLRKEFLLNMDALEKSSLSQRRLNDEIKLAQQQWVYFDYAIQQQGEKNSQLLATTVATTSERILDQMDIVTSLFQSLNLDTSK